MSKKEIRIFLIAVLAIAAVSLVTQIVSGFASAISLFTDAKKLWVSGGNIYNKEYLKLTATFLLIMTVISFAFVVGMICLCKMRRVRLIFSAIACGVVCLSFVIFAVIMAQKIPIDIDGDIRVYDYELFQQFLTVGIADAVAVIIVFASSLLLSRQPKERINNYRKYELLTEGQERGSEYIDSEN